MPHPLDYEHQIPSAVAVRRRATRRLLALIILTALTIPWLALLLYLNLLIGDITNRFAIVLDYLLAAAPSLLALWFALPHRRQTPRIVGQIALLLSLLHLALIAGWAYCAYTALQQGIIHNTL